MIDVVFGVSMSKEVNCLRFTLSVIVRPKCHELTQDKVSIAEVNRLS